MEGQGVEGTAVVPADHEAVLGPVTVGREAAICDGRSRRAEARGTGAGEAHEADPGLDEGGVRRARRDRVRHAGSGRGDPDAPLDVGDRAPGRERPTHLVPGVAVGSRGAIGDREEVALRRRGDPRRRGVRGGPHVEGVGGDPEEAAGRQGRGLGVDAGHVPGGDVALAVAGTDPERIAVAVGAKVGSARRLRGGEPGDPGAAIHGGLHVVAGDAAEVVGGRPADDEALVGLGGCREGHDPGLRCRGVVEELVGQRPVELRPRPVVAEGPDPCPPQAVPVDEVVACLERRGVVEVELAPRRHAAVGRRAGLLPVGGPGRDLPAVVAAPVLGGVLRRDGVVDGTGVAELRARLGPGVHGVGDGGPGPAVVGDPQDHPRGGDACRVGPNGVRQVVGRPGERIDGARLVRAGRPVVVAHDEDGVRPARGEGPLQGVVAREAHGVEREVVAGGDPVELGPDRPDQRHELVLVARDERLEVEVDPVGPAVPHGGNRLAGQVEARRRAAQERLLDGDLAGRPGKDREGERHPAALRVGGADDRGHLRARPAGPPGRQRAVAVALLQVPIGVGTHGEVGQVGEDVEVEPRVAVGDFPIGEEPVDLAAHADRRGGELGRAGRDDEGCPFGRDGSRVGRRRRERVGRGLRWVGRHRRGFGRSVRHVRHLRSRLAAGGKRLRRMPPDGPAVVGAWTEADRHPAAGRKAERAVLVGHRVEVHLAGLVAGPHTVGAEVRDAAGLRRVAGRGVRRQAGQHDGCEDDDEGVARPPRSAG